jgi:hypothetical protein
VDAVALAEIPLFAEMTEEEWSPFAGVCVELEIDAGKPVVCLAA